MSATTWTTHLAAMLADELAELEHTAACERAAVSVDGGLGSAALAAISAVPPGPQREFEIARWAKRLASEVDCLAITIPVDVSDEMAMIIAELVVRVRIELGGGS